MWQIIWQTPVSLLSSRFSDLPCTCLSLVLFSDKSMIVSLGWIVASPGRFR